MLADPVAASHIAEEMEYRGGPQDRVKHIEEYTVISLRALTGRKYCEYLRALLLYSSCKIGGDL
jgi:hypothetical protein